MQEGLMVVAWSWLDARLQMKLVGLAKPWGKQGLEPKPDAHGVPVGDGSGLPQAGLRSLCVRWSWCQGRPSVTEVPVPRTTGMWFWEHRIAQSGPEMQRGALRGEKWGRIRSQWPHPHLCWAEETHGGARIGVP